MVLPNLGFLFLTYSELTRCYLSFISKHLPVPVDLNNPVRSYAEEPPRAVLGPEPELAGEGHIPHDRPELSDILTELIRDIGQRREDPWREPYADERTRGCGIDGEMITGLRAPDRHLDLPPLSRNRDRIRQRPVRTRGHHTPPLQK